MWTKLYVLELWIRMDKKSTWLGCSLDDENRTSMYNGEILAIQICWRRCVFGEAADLPFIEGWEECII